MSKGPLSAAADLLRILALLMLMGLMGLFYRALQPPSEVNAAPRGYPGAYTLPDAGPSAPVTYGATLSHVEASSPPVIEGRMAGIYLKRRADCHASYVAADNLCVHQAIRSDPRGEAVVEAFRRGAVPPSVGAADGSVRWPATIQYERREMTRGSYNVVDDGRQPRPTQTASASGSDASAEDELRRLQQERRMQTAQDQAARDRRRAAANYEARVSRYERDQRWRRMQVNP